MIYKEYKIALTSLGTNIIPKFNKWFSNEDLNPT
jgi:hypothetical protein